MIKEQHLIEPDSIICSDNVTIVDDQGIREEIPMFSENDTTLYISVAQPSWKDNGGEVAENCPRNPRFDSTAKLGCFACGLSSISYNNGNTIYS